MHPKETDCGPRSDCGVCAPAVFERNNYFHDKRLTVRDFRAEQEYFQEKRFLINRMIHGQGVVCGLGVHAEPRTRCGKVEVRIEPGLALDGHGRELLVCRAKTLCLEPPAAHDPECQDEPAAQPGGVRCYVLCLEYCGYGLEPVSVPDGSCESTASEEHNRIRDSWRLRLRVPGTIDARECESLCPLDSLPECGRPCSDPEPPRGEEPREEREPCSGSTVTSVHDYLARERSRPCPECAPCDCVVLGTVTLTPPHERPVSEPPCEPEEGRERGEPDAQATGQSVSLDPFTARRLVYTNPLLYDLVQCYHGDLPRITSVNWSTLHRRLDVSWSEFDAQMRKGLRVCFDRPMDRQTIDVHTFRVELRIPDRDGYRVTWGVPGSVVVEPDGRAAVFSIDTAWADDEMHLDHSELVKGARVEIRLIGSLILDTCGKALDGEALRFDAATRTLLPTGNGVQGGDFVSYFTVCTTDQPEPEREPRAQPRRRARA